MLSILSTHARLNPQNSRPCKNERHTSQASPSKTKLQFITSLGPPKKARDDEASARIVRTHAMRSYLNHKDIRPNPSAAVQNPGTQQSATRKFKLKSWSRAKRGSKKNKTDQRESSVSEPEKKALLLQRDIGPFEILKTPLTPSTRRLLYHCTFALPSLSLSVVVSSYRQPQTTTNLPKTLLP